MEKNKKAPSNLTGQTASSEDINDAITLVIAGLNETIREIGSGRGAYRASTAPTKAIWYHDPTNGIIHIRIHGYHNLDTIHIRITPPYPEEPLTEFTGRLRSSIHEALQKRIRELSPATEQYSIVVNDYKKMDDWIHSKRDLNQLNNN